MGKPSNTNPMREPARLSMRPCANFARLCAAMVLACSLHGKAQTPTPSVLLPLVLPSAIVFDPQGNLYFAETGNHVVRRLSVAGIVTTVAGNGTQGFAGDKGLATAAELDSPAGLALDTAGDLYIADTHNQRVREVAAATGIITTVAGTGIPEFSGDNGAALSAQLDRPTALAIDAAGNLYIADTENHRVRKIATATSVITTVAGNGTQGFSGDNGPAVAAAIDSPNGIAMDAAGDLYLADTHNGRVRKVTALTGIITTVAGTGTTQSFSGDGGAATAATLALPRGLTIDAAGNLSIADSANHRIRRISSAGAIITVAGQGTETFAGDEAPAVSASLDTPRSVAVSPGGLLTFTDTQNQRIRQLDALPGPGPDIHTIAGVGITQPGTLVLSGPSVVAYGSGTVTATLNSSTNVTGTVTLLDVSGGTSATVGATSLLAGSATLATSALAAGSHSLTAVYAGDSVHAAAQSSTLPLAVTAISLAATANPVSILYGQPIPSLGGGLSGVLPQDAGNVAALFKTNAGALAPVGLYPVTVSLIGSAAGNYTVALPATSISIAQAQSLTTLTASTNAPGLGLTLTLNMQAASTTSGVPTGSVTLLDGSTVISVAQLSGGSTAFSTSTLALGTHSLIAEYSGDTNFLPSTSATGNITVGEASDFTLTPSGAASLSIPAGSAATFNFSVAMQGAMIASPVALAVQGTPPGATASLSPAYLPPGGAVTAFTLTIQTPLAGLDMRSHPFAPDKRNSTGSLLLALLLLPAIGLARRRTLKRWRALSILFLAATSCMLLTTLATGCGDRVNTGSESASAKTFTLTVTATATSASGTALEHSTNVSLKVL